MKLNLKKIYILCIKTATPSSGNKRVKEGNRWKQKSTEQNKAKYGDRIAKKKKKKIKKKEEKKYIYKNVTNK